MQVMEKVTGKPVPNVKFFNMTEFQIAGRRVRALRHGMVGQPGFELFGPWDDGEAVKAAIVGAGQEFGLHQSGSRTYPATRSVRMDSVADAGDLLGEKMKPYRQWLPATATRRRRRSALLFDNIEDYYLRRISEAYVVISSITASGASRSEKIAWPRREVTLVLNQDVTRGISTMFPGKRTKYFDSSAVYTCHPRQGRRNGDRGRLHVVRLQRERGAMLTLAIVDVEHSEPGTLVTFVWGEERRPGRRSRRSATAARNPRTVAPVRARKPRDWRIAS
jgi:syringate O-demethylase